jgi:hypothetical protein
VDWFVGVDKKAITDKNLTVIRKDIAYFIVLNRVKRKQEERIRFFRRCGESGAKLIVIISKTSFFAIIFHVLFLFCLAYTYIILLFSCYFSMHHFLQNLTYTPDSQRRKPGIICCAFLQHPSSFRVFRHRYDVPFFLKIFLLFCLRDQFQAPEKIFLTLH